MCCEFSDVGRRAGSPRAFGFCEKQTTQWSMHAHTHTAQSDTVRALSSHAHKIESLYPAARDLLGGTHARPLSTNLSACDILSVQSLIPYQCAPPQHTPLSLSHSSRLLVFPSSNSLLLLSSVFRPPPCPSLSCPHIPHYNTPAASRRVLTLTLCTL